MPDPSLNLKNPPIIEAVLDIECDLPPTLKINTIEIPAKKEFAKTYPKFRPQFFQEHKFEVKPNEPSKLSVKGGIVGLQFLHNDEKQVVQFRAQGFSFNRLAPYSSLDDYIPQIKRAWMAYAKLANPVLIRLIRLRYINRILLPFVEGKVDLDDYFRIGPRLADEKRFGLVGFLNQYTAVETATGYHVNSVITAQPPEGDKWPIIFDNTAMALESREPNEWNWIRSKILDLRGLKNSVFKETLTEKCLNRFQQL